MRSLSQAQLSFPDIEGLRIVCAQPEDAEVYRSLYHDVGKGHLWGARRRWLTHDFANRIAGDRVHVWLAKMNDAPVGFVELCEQTKEHTVQIVFLGVSPRFQGRGIGKYLLSYAINEAWELNPESVRLLTRSYDGEHALRNYLKRGFTISKVRSEVVGFPKSMKPEIEKIIRKAKERGVYPGILRRIEAHLRESPPGVAARWAVFYVRSWLKRLNKASND